jgi:hypothetical protein
VCVTAAWAGVACGMDGAPARTNATPFPRLPGQPTGVFTPAHDTMWSAVKDFFWIQGDPQQPLEFPHRTHAEQGLGCTDCHQGAEVGPVAGIPSVNLCMACHVATAIDRPRIKQITAMQEKGLDVPWQRVNRYTNQQHVRFDHAPHIRAKVECATCHGDIARQTVAERNVALTMGFCVGCHLEKNAPNECITCHF